MVLWLNGLLDMCRSNPKSQGKRNTAVKVWALTTAEKKDLGILCLVMNRSMLW